MIYTFKKKKEPVMAKEKPLVRVTASLADILRPGIPAVYVNKDGLTRTTVVQSILETSSGHVRFETENKIYMLFFNGLPKDCLQIA